MKKLHSVFAEEIAKLKRRRMIINSYTKTETDVLIAEADYVKLLGVGTTAERPTGLVSADAGGVYFDTETKDQVSWTGDNWSDMDAP